MTEELVTLETAKLLKDKGFQQRKYLMDVSTLHHCYKYLSVPPQSAPRSGCVKPRTCIFPSLEMLVVIAMIYAKLIMVLIYQKVYSKGLTMAVNGIPTKKHWKPEYRNL